MKRKLIFLEIICDNYINVKMKLKTFQTNPLTKQWKNDETLCYNTFQLNASHELISSSLIRT